MKQSQVFAIGFTIGFLVVGTMFALQYQSVPAPKPTPNIPKARIALEITTTNGYSLVLPLTRDQEAAIMAAGNRIDIQKMGFKVLE